MPSRVCTAPYLRLISLATASHVADAVVPGDRPHRRIARVQLLRLRVLCSSISAAAARTEVIHPDQLVPAKPRVGRWVQPLHACLLKPLRAGCQRPVQGQQVIHVRVTFHEAVHRRLEGDVQGIGGAPQAGRYQPRAGHEVRQSTLCQQLRDPVKRFELQMNNTVVTTPTTEEAASVRPRDRQLELTA